MNVSMQDGFNLGWKLAAVLEGRSDPAILHSYSAERQAVAAELIEFDREFATMFSAARQSAPVSMAASIPPSSSAISSSKGASPPGSPPGMHRR